MAFFLVCCVFSTGSIFVPFSLIIVGVENGWIGIYCNGYIDKPKRKVSKKKKKITSHKERFFRDEKAIDFKSSLPFFSFLFVVHWIAHRAVKRAYSVTGCVLLFGRHIWVHPFVSLDVSQNQRHSLTLWGKEREANVSTSPSTQSLPPPPSLIVYLFLHFFVYRSAK